MPLVTSFLRRVEKAAKVPEAVARFRALGDRHTGLIRRAWLETVDKLRDALTEEALFSAPSPEEAVTTSLVDNALQPFEAAISAAILAGGRLAAETQPSVQGPVRKDQVDFVFNGTNPYLSAFSQRVLAQKVREVSTETKALISEVVRTGSMSGDNPRTVARTVRESIGLTARQQKAVQNYRAMLTTLDREALNRALRDKRFDRSFLQALQNDKPLSSAQVDKMVARYRDRYLKYRSEVIARTEAIRALQGSQHELIQSYVDSGRIEERQVRRFWHHTPDERTRAAHIRIPGMNKNGVGLKEPFKTDLGPLMYPGDPNGEAANTIQCRCTVFTRVVSLELLEPPPGPTKEQLRREALFASRPPREEARLRSAFPAMDVLSRTVVEKRVRPLTAIKDDIKKTSHYNAKEMAIKMRSDFGDEDYDVTFRHEFGHHVDFSLSPYNQSELAGTGGSGAFYKSYEALDDLVKDGDTNWKNLSGPGVRSTDMTRTAAMKTQAAWTTKRSQKHTQRIGERLDAGENPVDIARDEWEKRGFQLTDINRLYPSTGTGNSQSLAQHARALAAWDQKDHKWLFERCEWSDPWVREQLGGTSDSIAASMGGEHGHYIGHGADYFKDQYNTYQQYPWYRDNVTKVSDRWGYGVSDMNTTQAFANYWEARNADGLGLKFFERFLPNTARRFNGILREAAKGPGDY